MIADETNTNGQPERGGHHPPTKEHTPVFARCHPPPHRCQSHFEHSRRRAASDWPMSSSKRVPTDPSARRISARSSHIPTSRIHHVFMRRTLRKIRAACYGERRSVDPRFGRICGDAQGDCPHGQQCVVRRSRRAARRSGACVHVEHIDGWPRPHSVRAGRGRQCHTANRQRSSDQHDHRRAIDRQAAGPSQILSSRHTVSGAHARKHHGGGRGDGAGPETIHRWAKGCSASSGPHLLRSSRRAAWRRAGRRSDRKRSHRTHHRSGNSTPNWA